jgi:hypothetical protein
VKVRTTQWQRCPTAGLLFEPLRMCKPAFLFLPFYSWLLHGQVVGFSFTVRCHNLGPDVPYVDFPGL